ncbi:MAG TPA: RidA family protein [Tepidisphaeraceae bacterium]|nr:RidA family protein [Tepidisphaeraceae bacterium]
MEIDVEKRLSELGWTMPQPPRPIAAYVPCVRSGSLLFVSGQLPWRDGKLLAAGKVPSVVSLQQAQQAAGQCAVHGLAILGAEIGGDWDKLIRVVRVGVFVLSDDEFTEQAKVANGASELLGQVLGERGKHARAAVGVNALPLGASVEAEFLFEIR